MLLNRILWNMHVMTRIQALSDEKTSYSSEVFVRMLSKEGLKKAALFLNGEYEHLEKMLASRSVNRENQNFIAIGGGNLLYIDLAYKYNCNYITVDPSVDMFLSKEVQFLVTNFSKIKLIRDNFLNLKKSDIKNRSNNIFIFLFNVISYIHNPIQYLNQLIKPGDTVFISLWNHTPQSLKVINDYFKYVYQQKDKIENFYVRELDAFKVQNVNKIKYLKEILYFETKFNRIFQINTEHKHHQKL